MTQGIKRASPGAEDEKPLSVELSCEQAKDLRSVQREQAKLNLYLEREAQNKLYPAYVTRRPILKSINNFWPVALLKNHVVAFHAQHNADKTALNYLEDLWVTRDPNDFRCFTLEFYFKDNKFFEDKVLKKEYKLIPQPNTANEKPDENGITDSMLEFSWETHVEGQPIKWKSEETNLTKSYPREAGDDDDELPIDTGSFFNFFEYKDDPSDIGPVIASEVFPDAIDYFLNDDEDDSEDEDDDSDDAEEIDLEKPRTKKQKV
ncbi:hypothetical protein FA15DRAFT_4919 [Coprinopsis marcescibilis]|uniref:Uncharacterized protein n=1 Tax=Coprinopsis marcescibilis TaxID=230819 RepID=A0A5C3LC81_COPMA|nr:hypothetical protein FA15DRAFT_4919 [Coprinopsis marcescibilis]